MDVQVMTDTMTSSMTVVQANTPEGHTGQSVEHEASGSDREDGTVECNVTLQDTSEPILFLCSGQAKVNRPSDISSSIPI